LNDVPGAGALPAYDFVFTVVDGDSPAAVPFFRRRSATRATTRSPRRGVPVGPADGRPDSARDREPSERETPLGDVPAGVGAEAGEAWNAAAGGTGCAVGAAPADPAVGPRPGGATAGPLVVATPLDGGTAAREAAGRGAVTALGAAAAAAPPGAGPAAAGGWPAGIGRA
jgi:hypothetical protein